ncbi:MAG: hypothetical protein R2848_14390 [Thermomicrobiales bacterium]
MTTGSAEIPVLDSSPIETTPSTVAVGAGTGVPSDSWAIAVAAQPELRTEIRRSTPSQRNVFDRLIM